MIRQMIVLLLLISNIGAKKQRKASEIKEELRLRETAVDQKIKVVGIVNLAHANVRLRCQSVLMDQRDHFLAPFNQFRFKFYDIALGNHHFWCDAYGLFDFMETFDVFGREAPSRSNITWLIKQDGLYMNGEQNRVIEWFWNYLPFSSYAE